MSNVYRIGVEIAMSNGVSPILGVIARDMLGMHRLVGKIEEGMGRWKLAIAGAVSAAAGVGMLVGMNKLVDKGAELNHLEQQMLASGMKKAEVAEAIRKSWEMTAKYQSQGVISVGEMIKDTRQAYGNTGEAIGNIQPLVQAATVLQGVLGGKGRNAVNDMFDLVKAAELRGISQDPTKVRKFIDDATKVATASGGRITGHDFLGFVQQMKTNAPYVSEEFLGRVAPTLMQELGARTAGTAITSLSQAIVGGKMSKKAMGEFVRMGLVDQSNIIHTTGVGTQIKTGGVKGYELFSQDPYLWAQQILLPAMLSHGGVTPEKRRAMFSALFSNRNAESAANILTTQSARIEKDRALYGGAKGIDFAEELQKHDYSTVMKSFSTQWNNMLDALGSPLVAPALEGFKSMGNVFSSITQFAAANPGAVRIIGETLAAVAVGLIALGGAAVGIAAFSAIAAGGTVGLAVAGIAAVVGSVATLVALNWDKVKWTWLEGASLLNRMHNDIAGWIDKFTGLSGGADRFGELFSKLAKFTYDFATGNILGAIADGRDMLASNRHDDGRRWSDLGGTAGRTRDDPRRWSDTRPSAVPPPAKGATAQRMGDVYLDGEKVGKNVLRKINDWMGDAQGGLSGHDPTAALAPVGMSYSAA